jgi:hypothetical protein
MAKDLLSSSSDESEWSSSDSDAPPRKHRKVYPELEIPCPSLPAEILLEILTHMGRLGPIDCLNSFLISKKFRTTLESRSEVSLRWSDLNKFNSNNKQLGQRRFIRHLKIDFEVKEDEDESYTTDGLLKAISEIEVKAPMLTVRDFYTRMLVRSIALKSSFAKSIKHIVTHESFRTTEAEENVPVNTFAQDDQDRSFSRQTQFTQCKDLFVDLSEEVSDGYGASMVSRKFCTFYDALEHVYVIVPKMTAYEQDTMFDLFVHSNILDKHVKIALIILWDNDVPSVAEKKMENLFDELIQAGSAGWTV